MTYESEWVSGRLVIRLVEGDVHTQIPDDPAHHLRIDFDAWLAAQGLTLEQWAGTPPPLPMSDEERWPDIEDVKDRARSVLSQYDDLDLEDMIAQLQKPYCMAEYMTALHQLGPTYSTKLK